MKRLSTYVKLFMIAAVASFAMIACEDEPAAPQPPLAFFTAAADADNSQLINFTNETEDGDSYVWDFGDGSATSTEVSPTHEYADGGEFTVTLTATNEGGDNVYTEDITVIKAAAENLVVNGTFDDESAWTVINLYECANDMGEVTIADGVATWSETATAEEGAWKHMGIYQELSLEAGTYNIDMWVEYAGIDAIWGEAYVGATVPTACTQDVGTDYADNRVLVAFNAWDCNQEYTGFAVANACNEPEEGMNGQFTIETAGTYYFLFKVGGASYGPNGIKIDDITLYKQ